ncbi:SMI1/KNR4 family protein [Gilliamella apicola]|uniref:SMI1/KNR4 family protein n=1 Tax=Gilliamella apicola TaxID=1196095 RepID=A0A556RGK4_9GAMM|nr:SMI1/KNR4 family protein [Gilliamella apicola]TSJ88010.1 SMI1/KNR4 family protein [Gilliamella apicola]
MTTIIYSKNPATLEDISNFEKIIKGSLPNDYKDFLMKYNGGQPQPNSFRFFSDRNDESMADYFLSLGREKYSNLLSYYDLYKDRIPSEFIPIAHDPEGNLIIMELKPNSNRIYFWDHELEADEDETPNMDNVYYINQSFTKFINDLYPLKEDEI